jgi:hypothetical protein
MDTTTEALHTDLIETLKIRLTSTDFMERHRCSPKDFTRTRCLPFVIVILFLLNMVKRAVQDELDEFFKLRNGEDVAVREVTKSAFTQARKKLKHEAFIELNELQVDYFYQHYGYKSWYGLRLLAVDGSSNQLPNSAEIVEHFGLWGLSPVARVSQMFDVLNGITVDALIGPKEKGEREFAALHFEKVGLGDLILTDRGYPAFWLFALILSKEADFCSRMPLGIWGEVDKFVETGLAEQIVQLSPTDQATKECQARGLSTDPLTVRLIRVELDNGEIEVLITSLLDATLYPHSLFKKLYHDRWPVEESYKVVKCRVEVENFSGKSKLSIYQDFHAKIFTVNLTAILAHSAQKVVKEQSQDKKYTYQINFTQALSKMKDTVVLLFQKSSIAKILNLLWNMMTHTIEPIRPDRKYPRQKRTRPKKFSMAYKPIR